VGRRKGPLLEGDGQQMEVTQKLSALTTGWDAAPQISQLPCEEQYGNTEDHL
jgi:hypothetical protein